MITQAANFQRDARNSDYNLLKLERLSIVYAKANYNFHGGGIIRPFLELDSLTTFHGHNMEDKISTSRYRQTCRIENVILTKASIHWRNL